MTEDRKKINTKVKVNSWTKLWINYYAIYVGICLAI